MSENGIWTGCGHKVTMILLCSCPTCFAPYVDFLDNNPKDLCFKCWKEENRP